jgi:hypothetical protein
LSTEIQVGNTAEGKHAFVVATGLLPGTTVYLYIYSTPQLIGSAVVGRDGSAKIATTIPAGLPTGDHKIVAVGTSVYNKPIQAISAFQLDSQSVVVAYAPPAQVSQNLASNQRDINRALAAGKPLYDIKLHPGAIASIALATASLVALVGAGGLVRFPGSTQDHRSNPRQGKLASAVTKKLKGIKKEGPRIGDASRSWRFPGTAKIDTSINNAAIKVGRTSALLPRLLVDGAWSRAMFGSAGLALWVAGIVLGVISSVQVHYQALPPKLVYVLIIVFLGLLDAAAGALAWFVIALLALFTGHITSWPELRTVMGIFVLFSSTILLGHAIRPLRRNQDGSLMQRFDRLADYVMPPIFLAFAASSMFKALNGLSGLELVQKSEFGALKITVIIGFILRMLIEDSALLWYPQRSLASQPTKLSSQTKIATWVTIVLKLSIFILIAAPFFGLGIYTWLAFAITAALLILKVFEEKIPNYVALNKWYPRGVAKFLMMMVIGTFVGLWILGNNPSNQKIISTFALMMVPGVISTLIETFGREGWNWPENWSKRVAGSVFWFVALGIVVGFITI